MRVFEVVGHEVIWSFLRTFNSLRFIQYIPVQYPDNIVRQYAPYYRGIVCCHTFRPSGFARSDVAFCLRARMWPIGTSRGLPRS